MVPSSPTTVPVMALRLLSAWARSAPPGVCRAQRSPAGLHRRHLRPPRPRRQRRHPAVRAGKRVRGPCRRRVGGWGRAAVRIATADAISTGLFVVAGGIVLAFLLALSRCPTPPKPVPPPCRTRPAAADSVQDPHGRGKRLAATPIAGRCEQLPESRKTAPARGPGRQQPLQVLGAPRALMAEVLARR